MPRSIKTGNKYTKIGIVCIISRIGITNDCTRSERAIQTPNGIPIEIQRRVATEKAKEAGKPEEILTKIADGSVNKFLKEITLLNQPFVKDDKISIETLLKNNNATIHSFYIYIVGDGIEKKEEDFAAEVAAASKG